MSERSIERARESVEQAISSAEDARDALGGDAPDVDEDTDGEVASSADDQPGEADGRGPDGDSVRGDIELSGGGGAPPGPIKSD